jgi:hypothetical protein
MREKGTHMHVKNLTEAMKIVRAQQRRRDIRKYGERTGAVVLGALVMYVIALKIRRK